MKHSDMLKELTRLFGGRYQLTPLCKRNDCCPGEPDHHVYVERKSVANTDHPVCEIVSRPHRHIERIDGTLL